MKQIAVLLLLLLALGASAPFLPNVRVDHRNLDGYLCQNQAIALGPAAPSRQPIYVVFEVDSGSGVVPIRSDVGFQKSTDGGSTWLGEDMIVRRGAEFAYPTAVATDAEGNVYVMYGAKPTATADAHAYCVRSSDGGATWSAPARIDDDVESTGGYIAADSNGTLFCALGHKAGGRTHLWSSVSTDRGATWSRNVKVCADTADHSDCYACDIFIQPGTNHVLMVTEASYHDFHAYLYRSTDMGHTFQPRVQLDTFYGAFTGHPHVIADREHVVCDYSGYGTALDQIRTEARTLYTQPDTWGPCTPVTDLDSLYSCYYNGNLAVSSDGQVQAVLLVNHLGANLHVYYASSSDHGRSWTTRERVDDDTLNRTKSWPDIAADADGHAYLVWQDWRGHGGQIWFSTNSPAAVAEGPVQPSVAARAQIVSRYDEVCVEYQLPASAHVRATLHDAVGRQVGVLDVGELQAGTHKLSWKYGSRGLKLSPGAYFVILDMGKQQARLKAVVR